MEATPAAIPWVNRQIILAKLTLHQIEVQALLQLLADPRKSVTDSKLQTIIASASQIERLLNVSSNSIRDGLSRRTRDDNGNTENA
jgi:hypothetical protein